MLVVAAAAAAVPVPDEVLAVPGAEVDVELDAEEDDAVPLVDELAAVVEPDEETPASVYPDFVHSAPLGTCHPFPNTPVT